MVFTNGDLKVVKNAGATISHPYGSTMRSLLVGIYALGAEEIIIMGHKDCGMGNIDVDAVMNTMEQRGVDQKTFDILEHSGIDVPNFLKGFDDVYENVKKNIQMIYSHPLFDKKVPVHGLVIDPHTGALDLVHDGYGKKFNLMLLKKRDRSQIDFCPTFYIIQLIHVERHKSLLAYDLALLIYLKYYSHVFSLF
ncbi:carbonic anhydrase [Staphylococcus aureus]|nr:carbonic anhydrase [Staphylococcus aureus]